MLSLPYGSIAMVTISPNSYFTDLTPSKIIFYLGIVAYVVLVSLVCVLEAFMTHECEEDALDLKFGNALYQEIPCRHYRMAKLLFLTPDECSFGRRLVMSVILGSVVGWERRQADRPAGIRTMSLVSLGACLFTIDSTFAFLSGPMSWDASRISAAIPSGVGFLGAGLIFKETEKDDLTNESNHVVHGLTTATSVWLSAAVGVACGGELYFAAWFCIAITLAMLRFGPRSSDSSLDDFLANLGGRSGSIDIPYGGTHIATSTLDDEDEDFDEEKRALIKNAMTERRMSVRNRPQLGGTM
jgi:putative Mg2+ transporter-C (MgtC) family protein